MNSATDSERANEMTVTERSSSFVGSYAWRVAADAAFHDILPTIVVISISDFKGVVGNINLG